VVKCYGYFMLESSAEDDISRDFGISEWDRGREHLGKPIRAMVKEYIDCDLRYTPNMIPSMMQSLLDINSLGIEIVLENSIASYLQYWAIPTYCHTFCLRQYTRRLKNFH